MNEMEACVMNPMDCKDIKALLSGLIDGELDAQTRHDAERHLADCQSCRDLVNETEALNDLIALDAQRLGGLYEAEGLPAGFEQVVLRQTVFAEAYQFAGRRWTSWLGWVAAAACLMLALSMWFVSTGNRQWAIGNGQEERAPRSVESAVGSRNLALAQTQPQNVAKVATHTRSWLYDGSLDSARTAARTSVEHGAMNQPTISVVPVSYVQQAETETIEPEVAQTLYAASNALGMLAHADLDSFADVDRVRQIAEYDELLERLADSRERLSPADRPAVLAAESVLLRVVNGPVSQDDVRILNHTVASLELPSRLEQISQRGWGGSSL
jgi:hypothetical protein